MGIITYATIVLQLSKAGIHAMCEELEEDCFCVDGNLEPLVDLINDAEAFCNPDAVFTIADKEREKVKKSNNKKPKRK